MSDDNEIVETTETEVAEVEQPEITAESGETAAKQEDSATPPGDDATAKPKKSAKERINELTRQRHEKERDLETARREAEYWKSQAIQKPQETQPQATSGAPAVEQFDSYEDYLRASARYEAEAAFNAKQLEREQAERQNAFNTRAEKVEIDDLIEVIYDPGVMYSRDTVDIAFSSEKGPEILYYLAKNPSENARIAGMDRAQAGYELGRLEASLSLPSPKLTSSAPPPIKSISGGGEPPQKDQEKMTPDEWRDWRNEQLRKKGAH